MKLINIMNVCQIIKAQLETSSPDIIAETEDCLDAAVWVCTVVNNTHVRNNKEDGAIFYFKHGLAYTCEGRSMDNVDWETYQELVIEVFKLQQEANKLVGVLSKERMDLVEEHPVEDSSPEQGFRDSPFFKVLTRQTAPSEEKAISFEDIFADIFGGVKSQMTQVDASELSKFMENMKPGLGKTEPGCACGQCKPSPSPLKDFDEITKAMLETKEPVQLLRMPNAASLDALAKVGITVNRVQQGYFTALMATGTDTWKKAVLGSYVMRSIEHVRSTMM